MITILDSNMNATTTQNYVNIITEYFPDLGKLFGSMVEHGYTLSECLELNEFHTSPNEIFESTNKDSETLEFILWLLPGVKVSTVIRNFTDQYPEHVKVDVWRPILEPYKDNFRNFINLLENFVGELIKFERYDLLNLLYEFGFDFSQTLKHVRYSNGDSVRRFRQVEYLLEHGADPNFKINRSERAALHYSTNDVQLVELLLDYGADPNLSSKEGTPLYIAMGNNYLDTIELLLDTENVNLLQLGPYQNTLLHVCRHSEFFDRLIEAGISIESVNTMGETPLIRLIGRTSHPDILQAFLKLNPNLEAKDYLGRTALCVAATIYELDEAKILIRHGANPDVEFRQGRESYYGYGRQITTNPKKLLKDHHRYDELFNHNSVKRA